MTIQPNPAAPQWPTEWQGSRFTGKYVATTGEPMTGTVTFTPSTVAVIAGTSKTIVIGSTVTVALDVNGAFDVILPATDDPDTNPTGWTYAVSENFSNGRKYSVAAPMNVTQDLTAVVPVPAANGTAIVRGEPGPSAYQTAVANGFVGTEAEWLASLDGGASRILVESAGTYPARPDPVADPVLFIGAADPNALGVMNDGDSWVNTAATDSPVYAKSQTRPRSANFIYATGPVGANLGVGGYDAYLVPFETPGGFRFVGVEIQVVGAGAAGDQLAIGLYSGPSDSWPPARLVDFGTVAIDTTGTKAMTLATPYDFRGEMVWIGVSATAGTTASVSGLASSASRWVPIQNTLHGDNRDVSFATKSSSFPRATMPATWVFGSINEGISNGPRVIVKGIGIV